MNSCKNSNLYPDFTTNYEIYVPIGKTNFAQPIELAKSFKTREWNVQRRFHRCIRLHEDIPMKFGGKRCMAFIENLPHSGHSIIYSNFLNP